MWSREGWQGGDLHRIAHTEGWAGRGPALCPSPSQPRLTGALWQELCGDAFEPATLEAVYDADGGSLDDALAALLAMGADSGAAAAAAGPQPGSNTSTSALATACLHARADRAHPQCHQHTIPHAAKQQATGSYSLYHQAHAAAPLPEHRL